NGSGWKPGTCASQGSLPEYDVSMWPLNISVGPPPAPRSVPRTFARPCSTCCHCTARPSSWNVSAMKVAIAPSLPVKLGIAIARLAHSTSLFRSILRPDARQHAVSEEPDLVVTPVAPELEHHVRAAGFAVLLDRSD